MNRIDRLHAILTHLQSKKRVTAQEVADRFEISLRTVYRDVKALEESGVPVIGEAGSGYSIMEGYRLPPVMFTQEEAAALLLGAKLAAQFSDASVQKFYDAALFKIKAVLRSADKDHVDNLDEHIAILRMARPGDDSTNQYLAALQKAIVEKKVIAIRYHSNNEETTERQVEPIGLCRYGHGWHLIGWCSLRTDYRDFRVSRIQRLQVKDECFGNKSHPSLQEYLEKMKSAYEVKEVVVLFKKEVARFIKDEKYYYGFLREEPAGDCIRMHFLVTSHEQFGRWLLMFTKYVSVESPDELAAAMDKYATEIQQHYGK